MPSGFEYFRYLSAFPGAISGAEVAATVLVGVAAVSLLFDRLDPRSLLRVIWRTFAWARGLLVMLGVIILGGAQIYKLSTAAIERAWITLSNTATSWNTRGHLPYYFVLQFVLTLSVGVVLGACIIWVRGKSSGGRPGHPKSAGDEARQPITSNVYMMSPELLANRTASAVTANPYPTGQNQPWETLTREVAQLKEAVDELASMKSYLEAIYLSGPSANYVSFALDEVADKLDDHHEKIEQLLTSRVQGPIAGIDRIEETVENKGGEKNSILKQKKETEASGETNNSKKTLDGSPKRSVRQIDPDSGSESNREDSDMDEEDLVRAINTIQGWVKTKTKAIEKSPKPATTPKKKPEPLISPGRADELAKLTEEDLYEELQRKRKQKREEKKRPIFLTEEEKQLPLVELERRWKEEERREKADKRLVEDLGTLNDEEKNLSKGEIKALLRQRKYEAWVRRMRAQGIPLRWCDTCQELATSRHLCMQTPWMLQGRRGALPVKDGLILSQKGTGDVKLQKRMLIDTEQVDKQFEALADQKRQMASRHARIEKLLKHTTESNEPQEEVSVVVDATMDQTAPQLTPKVHYVGPPHAQVLSRTNPQRNPLYYQNFPLFFAPQSPQ
jgi:hypothetical protein